MTEREIRRLAGYLFARLPEADLGAVSDPRQGWTKWTLRGLLNAIVSGLMAGCKGLAEIEEFTRALSQPMRRRLGFGGRVPDTTARDVICRLAPNELREALHRIVRAAKRRKALEPVDFPFSVLTLDGKVTAIPCWGDFVQRASPTTVRRWLVRTVTRTPVKAAGRPCIDAIDSGRDQREHFRYAQAVNESFGALPPVTYDAGALSEENGRIVVEAGRTTCSGQRRTADDAQARREHFAQSPVAQTVDILDKRRSVRAACRCSPCSSTGRTVMAELRRSRPGRTPGPSCDHNNRWCRDRPRNTFVRHQPPRRAALPLPMARARTKAWGRRGPSQHARHRVRRGRATRRCRR